MSDKQKRQFEMDEDGELIIRGNHLITDDFMAYEMYKQRGFETVAINEDGKNVYYIGLRGHLLED